MIVVDCSRIRFKAIGLETNSIRYIPYPMACRAIESKDNCMMVLNIERLLVKLVD